MARKQLCNVFRETAIDMFVFFKALCVKNVAHFNFKLQIKGYSSISNHEGSPSHLSAHEM